MLANRKMKDSGIDWIGEIPEDWKVIKLRQLGNFTSSGIDKLINPEEPLVRIINYTDVYNNKDYVLKDKDYMVVSAPQDKVMQHQVQIGDLIFTPSSETVEDIGISALVIETLPNTAFSYHVLRYTFNDEVYLGFKKYLCNNFYVYSSFSSKAKGTIRKTLSREDFKEQLVLLPSMPEQQKIADFLDEKCKHIDSVLEKTRASIEEYKQLKQSVITKAVTKGIRPNRPMKDSGNLWFGNIPSDWNVYKTKYLFSIKKNIAGEEGHTVLSITQKGIVPKDISKNEGQMAENYSKYQLVAEGDFAMNHMDLLTGWIDISNYNGVTSPDYRVFVLNKSDICNKQYYLYLMQMCYFNKIFYGLGQGVSGLGRWRLQADKFLNFCLPNPHINEQEEIVSYLDNKCSEIDKLIMKKEQLIEELETYKKSLIYEYVTGKKEVC